MYIIQNPYNGVRSVELYGLASGSVSVVNAHASSVGGVVEDGSERVSEDDRVLVYRNSGQAQRILEESLEESQLARMEVPQVTNCLPLYQVCQQVMGKRPYLQKDKTTCKNVLCREQ